MNSAMTSGMRRVNSRRDPRRRVPAVTARKRGASSRIEKLGKNLTRDGWMWTEKLRLWDRGQREHLSELVREDLAGARKNDESGARLSQLEQVLLALEYVEATDRSAPGFTVYRGGIWEVSSGGLPGLGKRA